MSNEKSFALEPLKRRDLDTPRSERPKVYALTERERRSFKNAYAKCSRSLQKNAETIHDLDDGALTNILSGISLALRIGLAPARIIKFSDLNRESLKEKILKMSSEKGRVHSVGISYCDADGNYVFVYPNEKGWRLLKTSPDMSAKESKFFTIQLNEKKVNKYFKEALNNENNSLHIIPFRRLSSVPLSWGLIHSFTTLLALELFPSKLRVDSIEISRHKDTPSKDGKNPEIVPDIRATLIGTNLSVRIFGVQRNLSATIELNSAEIVDDRVRDALLNLDITALQQGDLTAHASLRHARNLPTDQVKKWLESYNQRLDQGEFETEIKTSRRIGMVLEIISLARAIQRIEAPDSFQ